MRLVVVHGAPGIGKHTVAVELAARTGFRLLHYHALMVGLGRFFGWGTPPFIEMRDRLYPDTLRAAAAHGVSDVISTFAFEPSVRMDDLEALWAQIGADLFFVGLTCEVAEHRRRVTERDRGQLGGIDDFSVLEPMLAEDRFAFPDLPGPATVIDTTDLEPGAVVDAALAAAPWKLGELGSLGKLT